MNLTRKTWCEALRSGKYSQTKSKLRDEIGFCCMGVACDIVNPEYWEKEEGHCDYTFMYNNMPWYSILPTPFMNELNLSHEEHGQLTTMNDHGKSFAEIADYIEALP